MRADNQVKHFVEHPKVKQKCVKSQEYTLVRVFFIGFEFFSFASSFEIRPNLNFGCVLLAVLLDHLHMIVLCGSCSRLNTETPADFEALLQESFEDPSSTLGSRLSMRRLSRDWEREIAMGRDVGGNLSMYLASSFCLPIVSFSSCSIPSSHSYTHFRFFFSLSAGLPPLCAALLASISLSPLLSSFPLYLSLTHTHTVHFYVWMALKFVLLLPKDREYNILVVCIRAG